MQQGSQLAMAVLLALGVSAGVSACGGGGDSSSDPGTGQAKPNNVAASPTPGTPAAPVSASAPAQKPWTGTVIPLYSTPDNPAWSAVISAHAAHPSVSTLAVINPGNGPGMAALPAYTDGVAKLRSAGVKVIGYVYTSYGTRPPAEVQADMDRWHALYPDVTGIFFDELWKSAGKEDYYRGLTAYAKQHGFDFTIGNPGDDPAPTYVGTVDVLLIYESAGLPSQDALGGWHSSYERHNFGIIPHSVASLDASFLAAAKQKVGYVYVQNDVMPNPWDTVPPYLDQLFAAVE